MTIRQKKLAKNLGKYKTMQETMEASDYAPSTARQQQEILGSKNIKAMLEKELPNHKLFKRHNELLDKQEYIAIGKVGEREVVATGEIDANAVAKGLDMAYKLKSMYPKENGGININEAKILVMPAELINKYDLPSNSGDSSK